MAADAGNLTAEVSGAGGRKGRRTQQCSNCCAAEFCPCFFPRHQL